MWRSCAPVWGDALIWIKSDAMKARAGCGRGDLQTVSAETYRLPPAP